MYIIENFSTQKNISIELNEKLSIKMKNVLEAEDKISLYLNN